MNPFAFCVLLLANLGMFSFPSLHGQPCSLPSIRFRLGSSELDPMYYPELYHINTLMKKEPELKLKVIGHAELMDAGQTASGDSLSKARAMSIVDFLVGTYGIVRERFVIVHKGSNQPIIDNLGGKPKQEVLHAVNSRVEFECLRQRN